MNNWVGRLGVSLAIAFAIAWILTVLLSGMGQDWFGFPWDFETTAQLGDSFGVLSSGMASIAAYFAYRTYQAAHEEGRVTERRAFETSFLNLVERRNDVLERVRLAETSHSAGIRKKTVHEGQAALDYMMDRVYAEINYQGKTAKAAYDNIVDYAYGFSSFMRYTYHCIALVDRQYPISSALDVDKESDGYQMLRLLRAQMTESELLLLALNCLLDSGYGKLKPLVERYAFLHNMPLSMRQDFSFDDFFDERAFGASESDRANPGDWPPEDELAAFDAKAGKRPLVVPSPRASSDKEEISNDPS